MLSHFCRKLFLLFNKNLFQDKRNKIIVINNYITSLQQYKISKRKLVSILFLVFISIYFCYIYY